MISLYNESEKPEDSKKKNKYLSLSHEADTYADSLKQRGLAPIDEPKKVESKKLSLLEQAGNELSDIVEGFKESASGRNLKAGKQKGSGVGENIGELFGPIGGAVGSAGLGAAVGTAIEPGLGTLGGALAGGGYGLWRGYSDYINRKKEEGIKDPNQGAAIAHGVLEGGLNTVAPGIGGGILKRAGINAGLGGIFGAGSSIIDQQTDKGKIDLAETAKATGEGALYGAALGEGLHQVGKFGGKIGNKLSRRGNSTPTPPNNASIKPLSSESSFDTAFNHVVNSEGGYVNHPNDKGGATNHGVIQSTYDGYRARNGLPKQSVTKITADEVKNIYQGFWNASGADKLSLKEGMAVFDMAINSGAGAAKKLWKQSGENLEAFMQARKNFYDQIVAKDPSQKVFYKGWMNRLKNLQAKLDKVDNTIALTPQSVHNEATSVSNPEVVSNVSSLFEHAPDYSLFEDRYVGKNTGGPYEARRQYDPLIDEISTKYKVDSDVVRNLMAAEKYNFKGQDPAAVIENTVRTLRGNLDATGGSYEQSITNMFSNKKHGYKDPVQHILGKTKAEYEQRAAEWESDPYIQSGRVEDLFNSPDFTTTPGKVPDNTPNPILDNLNSALLESSRSSHEFQNSLFEQAKTSKRAKAKLSNQIDQTIKDVALSGNHEAVLNMYEEAKVTNNTQAFLDRLGKMSQKEINDFGKQIGC